MKDKIRMFSIDWRSYRVRIIVMGLSRLEAMIDVIPITKEWIM